MNWDAIGAIAETLGAVGVIASLAYLAGQVRDSRRSLRASASQLTPASAKEIGGCILLLASARPVLAQA